MAEMKNPLKPLLDRFVEPYDPIIWCGLGWTKLLLDLNSEIEAIDPLYSLYQVKEKFGTLRFYYAPSAPDKAKQIDQIIRKYEQKSAFVCEDTGLPGRLMQRGSVYRTLCDEFIVDGWMPVDQVS